MATAARIDDLRKLLDQNPEDLRLAWEYWAALGDVRGTDVRSGRYVVEAFGRSAQTSDAGAIALAKAYEELCDVSGEGPMKRYFSDALISALHRTREHMAGDDWLITSLDTGVYEI
jgi:hypothetical protein